MSSTKLDLMNERHMLGLARWAADAFQNADRNRVLEICESMVRVAANEAARLAQRTVDETGYGVVADKTLKNTFFSRDFFDAYRKDNFAEPVIDHERKIVKFPRPAGLVFALIPVTNPVATTFFKAIAAVMTRSAVILCPHPSAKMVCCEAADLIIKAAEDAGAPKGLIQMVREPSLPLVQEFLTSPEVDVILATGGPAMVRAAYSSGNPAIGVGPGNVPCLVDGTADLDRAAKCIVQSKSFDNSLGCPSESVVIAVEPIADELAGKLISNGVHHVEIPEDIQKLRNFCFPDGKVNPKIIGKTAQSIAKGAGIRVAPNAKILGVEIKAVGKEEEFSREKLFPVLGFLKVPDFNSGLAAAQSMIRMGGAGHSGVIHSRNPHHITKYGATLRVYRVSVGAPGSTGSAGIGTNLPPSLTIGTGYFGRSSIGENFSPHHLVHWTSVAYSQDAEEVMGNVEAGLAETRLELGRRRQPVIRSLGADYDDISNGNEQQVSAVSGISADDIRRIVMEELREALKNG